MSLWQWLKYRKENGRAAPPLSKPSDSSLPAEQRISDKLEHSITHLKEVFADTDDLIVRRIHAFGRIPAALFYLEHLTDQRELQTSILRPILGTDALADKESHPVEANLINRITQDSLLTGNVYVENDWSCLIEHILYGRVLIFLEGQSKAIVAEASKKEYRSISQPETEPVIRGPREGFIENYSVNLSLLRNRLPTADLVIKTIQVGQRTKTKVAVCYLRDVCNPALVHEVLHRLNSIEIDGIVDSGYLEQYIEDNNFSPFPQIQNTERPDKSVANLLEGRVVIIVDGSPFALIAPAVFSQFYQSVDDYSERYLLSSFVRLSRLVALLFSLIFPALYVSVISYNPELIPTEFAVAVAGGRAGVPFPALVEVLIMEISMEVLREATIRLPQQVGGALSIVGVLVIGQAAVSAGFASPITVVVIALTTIGSFATPAYNMALALRLLRFPLIILGGVFGLYGVMVGLILIVNHMLSVRSFGVPYMSPVVPGQWQGMKDTVVRAPFWTSRKRPAFLHPQDPVRSGDSSKPLNEKPHNPLDPVAVGNRRREDGDPT
ncbi:spore germination protein [Brevibacillus ruminantium]|uniref:Spore germination protein n=1 Tax=Brevibacillus ruminantium TaxID=2950604 RepID=A0ABY4WQ50_9BACL|nr:spore germination protein [Brevibacillus ruminantium]USG67990.1 spore germination protein [Brevibacillus ruminantium]